MQVHLRERAHYNEGYREEIKSIIEPDIAQRVVIEVDGSQHFSQDGTPSLALYAEMVSADCELRLAGYEVYRFGANELVGSQAVATIERFFNGLWTRYDTA